MAEQVLLKTHFPELTLFRRGKVRDVYDMGDTLLFIATDRISCFDVVLPDGIPYKGKILTAMSLFWFEYLKDAIQNHLITADVEQYPEQLKKYADVLRGRSMLVKKTRSIPVECVVRGYLTGSGLKEYREKGSVSGVLLPKGLEESSMLGLPIFTPSTKEETGHDVNISYEQVIKQMGENASSMLREYSVRIYARARDYAFNKGIILADSKFEFGFLGNDLILIDEVLTPDSSRFWPKDTYKPGAPQPSFDKQFVRDYLEGLDWDKNPPAPNLPEDIILKTSEKYLEAYKRLTGKQFTP
ncbi:MAG: phosphoribosylaminoimidazolesuccinocarboxamide synthase [Deltaproteobacteria bacterium]